MHDPHRQTHPGIAEDYTVPFLCMALLLLVATLILVWGTWGYGAALLLCAGLHALIARWGEVSPDE